MNSEDETADLPAVVEDAVSTGAAADSVDCDERLKGLPRLLRYAVLSTNGAQHVAERLIAEIHELCPQLPHSAAWASERTFDAGVALAAELDHRAVTRDEPNLRSLADCVRLLSLPTPRSSHQLEEHKGSAKHWFTLFMRPLGMWRRSSAAISSSSPPVGQRCRLAQECCPAAFRQRRTRSTSEAA